jgi:hypothetical protein
MSRACPLGRFPEKSGGERAKPGKSQTWQFGQPRDDPSRPALTGTRLTPRRLQAVIKIAGCCAPIADPVPTDRCADGLSAAHRMSRSGVRHRRDASSRQMSTPGWGRRREQRQFRRRQRQVDRHCPAPPGSRGCPVSPLAVEPCGALADHPGGNRLGAMPVVQHYSRHGRRAEVP